MPLNEIIYQGFPAKTIGNKVYGVERMAKIRAELEVLHREQWKETEALYLGEEFTPDYDYLIQCEKEYRLLVFTVRDLGEVVGNLIFFITANVNKNHELQAQENSFYIIPAMRKEGIGKELLAYAEDYLEKCSVRQVVMVDKSPLGGVSLGKFFASRGFKPVALSYFKSIG